MAFSEEVRDAALKKAHGRCERCGKQLGTKWHAHHRTAQVAGGSDGLQNCEVLCVDCHENTRSYGRSA